MFLWSMRQYKDNLIKNGYTVFYHSIDEESFNEKYEDKLLKVIKDNDTLMFTIVRNKDQTLIGCCGLVYINWVHRHADLSLYI